MKHAVKHIHFAVSMAMPTKSLRVLPGPAL
jgi:hypothetical protein